MQGEGKSEYRNSNWIWNNISSLVSLSISSFYCTLSSLVSWVAPATGLLEATGASSVSRCWWPGVFVEMQRLKFTSLYFSQTSSCWALQICCRGYAILPLFRPYILISSITSWIGRVSWIWARHEGRRNFFSIIASDIAFSTEGFLFRHPQAEG